MVVIVVASIVVGWGELISIIHVVVITMTGLLVFELGDRLRREQVSKINSIVGIVGREKEIVR